MQKKVFIQVILPLKLDWAPFYEVKEEQLQGTSIHRGTRVRVIFARRPYVGVVTDADATPPKNLSRILAINEIASDLEPITEEELKLWEFLSEYYLCSIGEVYKSAYPGLKIRQEQIAAKAQEREEMRISKAKEMLQRKMDRLQERIQKREEALQTARKESRIACLKQEIADLEIQLGKAKNEFQHIGSPEEYSGLLEKDWEEKDIQLSPAQEKAYQQIHEAFDKDRIVLLNGVTGSGKTEIYINLAKETLDQGRNVLYLVPEILMGNQLACRLKEIFGNRLLAFNSSQTTAERYRIAEKVKSQNYIVLGTRSSIFLPHANLGLIIVDEEHDTSYKQQDINPRYNGRDTAIVMARIFGSKVILGSATPSLESLYNCEKGRYEEVSLTEKYYEADGAEVVIIDTIAERKKRGMRGLFSLKLIDQIKRTLEAGEQVLVLRSRRAYSPIVQCDTCGNIPHCPHCNVTLSYHKAQERLVCHYCGYSEPYDHLCHHCQGHLEPMGSGTQKVEEEARQLFPNASIARLDSDTASSRNYMDQTVRAFYKGEIDILVGTQIVAKGLDFPNLSLVVMLQADAMMGIEDFRADERALQLLEQFRGRCARRNKKGKFVIQTSQPAHPIYKQITGENSGEENIIGTFLTERKLFNYPPYTRAVNIIIRDNNEARLRLMSEQLYSRICQTFGMEAEYGIGGCQSETIQVIPPYSPVIDKVSDEYIRHLRISFKRDASLARNKKLLHSCISSFENEKKYQGHLIADVDPI